MNAKKTSSKYLSDVYHKLKTELANGETQLEAAIILEHVLNISAAEIVANPEMQLTQNQLQKIERISKERKETKKPLAYILEEAPFFQYRLFVNKDVLIPRPETEQLVEIVLDEIKKRKISQARILDLGTGSGCLAIALKKALPSATVYASDISKGALNVAAINARRYEADITFVFGDYLDPFIAELHSHSPISSPVISGEPPFFDVVVSNPPYISEEDYQKLEAELFHEPKHALVGFPYEHIREQLLGLRSSISFKKEQIPKKIISDEGFMAFEFGENQSKELLKIFSDAKIIKDINGKDRFLLGS